MTEASLMRAIELNDVAIDWNKQAFRWGRYAAIDMKAVTTLMLPELTSNKPMSTEELIMDFERELVAYQSEKYAARYRSTVDTALAAEKTINPDSTVLTEAIAHNAYKLMAYKDEYEVARLYSDKAFIKNLHDTFEGNFKLQFHLAPPLISPRDKDSGQLAKNHLRFLDVEKHFQFLPSLNSCAEQSGDIMGKSAARKAERKLVLDYEAWVRTLATKINARNFDLAVEIASIPKSIRGYGHVKEKNMTSANKHRDLLMKRWRSEDASIS